MSGEAFVLDMNVVVTATVTHPPVEEMTDEQIRHLGIGEQS
jgi:hypothetical protein